MIEARDLSGGYGRRNDVVGPVSLTFADGRITVLTGPNGSGKSTLLKLCCGQLKRSGGEVLLERRPLDSLSRTEIARAAAYLPQNRATPDIAVENLVLHGRFPWLGYPRIYRQKDRAAALRAMERTGIAGKRKKRMAELSGGERQKAYLAMLLAQDTRSVLLDEPTTYLDVAHQLELEDLLFLLKREGKAVGVVLHDLNLALDCADAMAVMKEGRLLFFGPPEKALSSGVLEKTFGVRILPNRRYGFSLR